jgi:hypothetical protein
MQEQGADANQPAQRWHVKEEEEEAEEEEEEEAVRRSSI